MASDFEKYTYSDPFELPLSLLDPKVTDFGLARISDSATMTASDHFAGTPAYMAPEQALGNSTPMSPRTDIYGLGAVLYELLTGRPPFTSVDPRITLSLVRDSDPVKPAILRPGLARDLNTICLKCLAKAPEQRYASAQEMAADLLAFSEDRSIKARPTGVLTQAYRTCRRHWKLTAISLLLSLSILLLLAGSMTVAARERKHRIDAETLTSRAVLAEQKASAEATKAAQTAEQLKTKITVAFNQLLNVELALGHPGITLSNPEEARQKAREGLIEVLQSYLAQLDTDDQKTWSPKDIEIITNYVRRLRDIGRSTEADEWTTRLQNIFDRSVVQDISDSHLLRARSDFYFNIASGCSARNDLQGAYSAFMSAADSCERLHELNPTEPECVRMRSAALVNAALTMLVHGDLQKAIGPAREGRDTLQFLYELTGRTDIERCTLLERHRFVLDISAQMGDVTAARESVAAARDLYRDPTGIIELDQRFDEARRAIEAIAAQIAGQE